MLALSYEGRYDEAIKVVTDFFVTFFYGRKTESRKSIPETQKSAETVPRR